MLLNELKTLVKRSSVQGCVVGVWAHNQDAEFKEVFELMQKTPGVNLTEALNLIKKHQPNVPFKRTSFVMHMRGNCTCQTA